MGINIMTKNDFCRHSFILYKKLQLIPLISYINNLCKIATNNNLWS